jgi:hypothetical protein
MPSTSRPADRSCTVAAAIAVSAGDRDDIGMMPVPRRRLLGLAGQLTQRDQRVPTRDLGEEDRRVPEPFALSRQLDELRPGERIA